MATLPSNEQPQPFPQGTSEPQGSPMEQQQQAAPAQAALVQPVQQEDFQSDPEFMAALGDAIDDMRTAEAEPSSDALRPVAKKVSHYVTRVKPDPSGGWAALFSPKDYHEQVPVYEGETDDDAISREEWNDQKPTGYMIARTASQATFGATSHLWTKGFEEEYQVEHENDLLGNPKQVEIMATANNLIGWKVTPAGKVLDTVFRGTTGYMTRKVMQSSLAKHLIEERLAVPIRAWMQTAFGRTTDAAAGAAASAAVRLEQALSQAGGHALADGSLYVPEAASAAMKQEVKQAATVLRSEMGAAATPIKVVKKDFAVTGLNRLIQGAIHVGGGSATGASAGAIDSLTQYMLGGSKEERMAGLAELPDATKRGAKFGAVAGGVFGALEQSMEAFRARGSTIPAGSVATQPDLARLRAGLPALPAGSPAESVTQENVWNVQTMGPVPTGWKGKVISK